MCTDHNKPYRDPKPHETLLRWLVVRDRDLSLNPGITRSKEPANVIAEHISQPENPNSVKP